MPKFMVSMSDDLFAEVDAEAARAGTNRSAVLRRFVDSAFRRRDDRVVGMEALLSAAAPRGGDAADQVKRNRLQL